MNERNIKSSPLITHTSSHTLTSANSLPERNLISCIKLVHACMYLLGHLIKKKQWLNNHTYFYQFSSCSISHYKTHIFSC